MSTYFSDSFIRERKQEFVNSLGSMLVNIGTTDIPQWIEGQITKRTVDDAGVMIFQCAFTETAEKECTVCQVKLLDVKGAVATLFDKSITTAYGQGVYVTVKIRMTETAWEVE